MSKTLSRAVGGTFMVSFSFGEVIGCMTSRSSKADPSPNMTRTSQHRCTAPVCTPDLESVIAPAETGSCFVALSKFTIANAMAPDVKTAFRNRPHKVDLVDGFLRLEVISPVDEPNEIWLITFWRDEATFDSWHGSHLYHESHEGIPKGLKLVPKSAGIRRFEGVAN